MTDRSSFVWPTFVVLLPGARGRRALAAPGSRGAHRRVLEMEVGGQRGDTVHPGW